MMIPLAIAIGIVEDKIANDLTSNKTAKEHLEDVAKKFRYWKPKTKKVILHFRYGSVELEVTKIMAIGNFIEIITEKEHILHNADEIRKIEVKDE